ncbi:MAG TPA: lamin tail domain-containing protein [Verrucomicrobiae bacterium]|nr:lamin tail domain-containing protein [Verrucomicrobiae bacterium]
MKFPVAADGKRPTQKSKGSWLVSRLLLLLPIGALGLAGLGQGVHAAAPVPQSLFPASKTGNDSGPEGTYYELGTIFRANVPGSVTQLRVYALATESGLHTARLWRNSDNTVVAGPFTWTYGGAAGWTNLDIPDVAILPNTDYTIAISTGAGGRNYPFLANDLAAAGGNGLNLSYPAGAGVFVTTAGTRPTQTFQNANYLRDVVFVAAGPPPATNGPVQITEFLAENESGLRDEDGDYSDWIEIYNPSAVPVALGGYQFLAGATNWTFPSMSLSGQEFLVVFASGKNRTNPAALLHTNFKLSSAGEYLALRDASNNVLSEFAPAYPPQRADYSAGREADGRMVYFQTPTPGFVNGDSFAGFVEDLALNVKRGIFSAPVQVVITNFTAGAVIHYTLNGATPTETSPLYTGPLTLSATTTLRARAFKPGFRPTKTHTGTYLFFEDVLRQSLASAQAYGWPAGPINGQEFRHGIKANFAALYTTAQMLGALRQIPSISVVTDQPNLTDPSTGLYVNPSGIGPAWERPVSIELIQPDGSDGFQEDCGLRIRGGQSSTTGFPKHSFHVFFRRDYGAARLHFALFGQEAAAEFDTIDLRCEHGYAYADPYPYSDEFTAIRDVFCRDLWGVAGYASTRSRPYHLYLNGQYWGLYQTQERAQEDYGSTYFGGEPEDYDVIKATGLPQTMIENAAGDFNAWSNLWRGARAVAANPTDANYFALLGQNADGTGNPALPVLLDPHELAAYMLLHYYTGHADEPLSVSFNWERPNNFRVVRRRGLAEPFHFFVHDGESSVLAPQWFNNRANAANLTSPNRANFNYSNPEWIHEDLLAHAEYRTVFWDEAQRLLFHDGAFTPARAQTIWDTLAAQINQAVIGESIRWGNDFAKARQSVWAAKIAQVRTNFFPGRTATVLTQLRQRNLYPALSAPVLNHDGGIVPPGFEVYLTNTMTSGSLYYGLDGIDPRARGGGLSPAAFAYAADTAIPINTATTLKARLRDGTNWSALVTATFYPSQDFTGLLVTEIMYNPPDIGVTTGDNFEFLELKNGNTNALDLSGLAFTEGITFTFSNGASLGPGQFFVLGRNGLALTNKYPGLVVDGLYAGKLNNGGEQLTLRHPLGGRIFSFAYQNSGRWPLTPDGWGFSLVPREPNANPDPGNPSAWRASTLPGGSPGADDPPSEIPRVFVNEVLTHTALPEVDAIELFNPNADEVDITGWFLTDDDAQPRKFRIPAGTRIAPGGYRLFTETDFNPGPLLNSNSFSLSADGDEVYLFSADGAGNLTGYSHGFHFGAAAGGVSFGRYVISTGDEHFVAQRVPTLQAANAGPQVGPVVIKEIMYHPLDQAGGLDETVDEYIEIANITAEAVPLFDPSSPANTWQLRGGVKFDFPTNVTLRPGGSLVLVNFNPAESAALASFRGRYGQFAATPVSGPYLGKLNNDRDEVELNRPGPVTSNGVPRILVEAVNYHDAAPWPVLADGGGGSLQRLQLAAYGDDPINWTSTIPLTISSQPASIETRPGSNVVFSVSAIGNGPLTYQWRTHATNLINNDDYAGVNSATLRITNVQARHRGDYEVTVNDAGRQAVSAAAALNVLIAPAFVRQPQSVIAVAGDTVNLSVVISNTASLPLGFRWRRGGVSAGVFTLNAYTSVLSLTNVTNDATYTVLVTNVANANGILSAPATLTVLADSDADHLPDIWMMQYFGHTNGLSGDLSRAADDADADGVNNLAEYVAGTNPLDRRSFLKLELARVGLELQLSFDAMSNKTYTVQAQARLGIGLWEGVFEVPMMPTNRLVTFVTPIGAGAYYRVITPGVP